MAPRRKPLVATPAPTPTPTPTQAAASASAPASCWDRRTLLLLLLAAALAVVAAAHVRRHVRGPREARDATILQAPAARVTAALLAERQPLVIDERVVDPTELLRTVFRWQYIWASGPDPCPAPPPAGAAAAAAPLESSARFTLLWFSAGAEADAGVLIQSRVADVLVRLAVGRVLVLPPGWRYSPTRAGCLRVRLEDPITFFSRGL
jgi:hypothetical protein